MLENPGKLGQLHRLAFLAKDSFIYGGASAISRVFVLPVLWFSAVHVAPLIGSSGRAVELLRINILQITSLVTFLMVVYFFMIIREDKIKIRVLICSCRGKFR